MKVLRVISSMDPKSGGPCQGIRNAIPELVKQGIYTEVICLDNPDELFLKNQSFPILALGPAKSSWFYCKKLMPWLISNLNRFDAVVVHGLWQYHGYAVNKAINYLKKAKAVIPRFYVMPHGMLDPYFQTASDRKLKALRNLLYWKFIESKIINNADGILFTCDAELKLARETFRPYHPKKELNVAYGVEAPPAFETLMTKSFLEKCPQVVNQPFILFLSRIHEKKGIDHLIEAYSDIFKKANEQSKSNGIHPIFPKLVIAGPGLETQYGRKMQQIVNESGKLNESVFFVGMLTGSAKWGAFYGCEAFILPSHQENFGIAVAEALACGKPVLVSRQVNIWSEIVQGGGGIAEDDTTEGTKKLLESWRKLPDEAKKEMGRKALNTFLDNFSIIPATKRFSLMLQS